MGRKVVIDDEYDDDVLDVFIIYFGNSVEICVWWWYWYWYGRWIWLSYEWNDNFKE